MQGYRLSELLQWKGKHKRYSRSPSAACPSDATQADVVIGRKRAMAMHSAAVRSGLAAARMLEGVPCPVFPAATRQNYLLCWQALLTGGRESFSTHTSGWPPCVTQGSTTDCQLHVGSYSCWVHSHEA